MMVPQSTQLVIFDCDGVLVDSEPIALDVLVDALAVKGISMDAEGAAERFLGRSISSLAEVVRQEFQVEIDQAFLTHMREALYARFRSELKPIAGIERVVTSLKEQGISWCVASSSQRERIELSLAATGLLDHFKPALFSATMVENGKPAPDLFLFAAAQMGANPAACVVVEDSPAGILAAQAAGMAVCAFTGGSHTGHASYQAALAALHPDARFDAMEELLHFVHGARRPEDHSDA